MPGKGAKERRKLREEDKIQQVRMREVEYISKGGAMNCESCINYSRCPVCGDYIMPCWIYNGYSEVK